MRLIFILAIGVIGLFFLPFSPSPLLTLFFFFFFLKVLLMTEILCKDLALNLLLQLNKVIILTLFHYNYFNMISIIILIIISFHWIVCQNLNLFSFVFF